MSQIEGKQLLAIGKRRGTEAGPSGPPWGRSGLSLLTPWTDFTFLDGSETIWTPSLSHLMECMAPGAQKQAHRFSQFSTNKASFWHLPDLSWRYFTKWVWRKRSEKFRIVEKCKIGREDQKLKETCFWDFHISVGMAQRVWAPSQNSNRENHPWNKSATPCRSVRL